jgi:hypothetical protein
MKIKVKRVAVHSSIVISHDETADEAFESSTLDVTDVHDANSPPSSLQK